MDEKFLEMKFTRDNLMVVDEKEKESVTRLNSLKKDFLMTNSSRER